MPNTDKSDDLFSGLLKRRRSAWISLSSNDYADLCHKLRVFHRDEIDIDAMAQDLILFFAKLANPMRPENEDAD